MSLRKVSQLTSWTSYLLLQEKYRIPRRYRRTVATLLIFVTKNAWHSWTKQKNQQPTKCVWVGWCSWWHGSAEFDRWPWSGHRSLWSVQCCLNLQRVGKSIFIGYGFAFFGMVMNVKYTLKEQIGKEKLHGCVKSEMVARIISRFLSTVIWYMERKCANIKCCSSGFSDNCRRRNFEIHVSSPVLMWPSSTCCFLFLW